MAHDSEQPADLVSRRKVIGTVGGTGIAAIAGCASNSGSNPTEGDGSPTEAAAEGTTEGSENTDGSTSTSTQQTAASTGPLEAGGSSTVYPIANKAASYWNANRPASDTEYWPHNEYEINTNKNLADYWGSLYGFGAKDSGDAPYVVTVALSHSGTGVEKVMNGQIDLGNSSGNVEDELPDRDSYENFIDHVVGVDGQPIVVSSEIAEAGVTEITGDELKGLYKGQITNWSELGGPDRDIQVLGRVKGSGTRTSFVSNVFDNPEEDTQVANRYGQNQRLAQAIAQADNAISYLALAFLGTDGVTPIALNWEGTTYEYGNDENGLDAKAYPLSRDLHMYTWEDTSMKEAAFLNMILHDFGQETFVKPNNYFTLSERRQKEQKKKLPNQV